LRHTSNDFVAEAFGFSAVFVNTAFLLNSNLRVSDALENWRLLIVERKVLIFHLPTIKRLVLRLHDITIG
jgi:hypothetical protein